MTKDEMIALLNRDLAGEFGAIIQYLTYAAKATGPYRPQLAQFFLGEVADEQAHAQYLANKIVALGGEPTTEARPTPAGGDQPGDGRAGAGGRTAGDAGLHGAGPSKRRPSETRAWPSNSRTWSATNRPTPRRPSGSCATGPCSKRLRERPQDAAALCWRRAPIPDRRHQKCGRRCAAGAGEGVNLGGEADRAVVAPACRSGGIGRRDSLKNCWGATPVPVRVRPSAPAFPAAAAGAAGRWRTEAPEKSRWLDGAVPSSVTVARGTLDPLVQVRILARQPTSRSPVAQLVERAAVNR